MKSFPLLTSLLLVLGASACAQQGPLVPVEKLAPLPADEVKEVKVARVVHISVDALGAKYLQQFLAEAPDEFPAFARLQREGASTFNARTDFTHTNTLPNHTTMVTGRPVKTPKEWAQGKGHFWLDNGDFPAERLPASLHATNPDAKDGDADGVAAYTASVFDVAHDAGLKTALYAGKSKFRLFSVSFGPQFGAEADRGRNKVDGFIIENDNVPKALADLKKSAPNYAFLHFANPDSVGHAKGYLGPQYRDAVKEVDGQIGQILEMMSSDEAWKDRSAIILSADHGGQPETLGHGDETHPFNYTIPFMVWGAGVRAGADLYALNPTTRTDPGEARPDYGPTNQPIRNGDGGNLALKLLGLPAIPGSSVNDKQDLAVR